MLRLAGRGTTSSPTLPTTLSVSLSHDPVTTSYDSWDMWNASVGYNFGSWGQITIGANNLTDEDPLLNDFGTEVDEYQYPKVGRVYYAEYTLEF